MYAYISSFYALKFEPILKEWALYSINRFQVKKAKFNFNAVPGEYNIHLTRTIKIEELHEDVCIPKTLIQLHFFLTNCMIE